MGGEEASASHPDLICLTLRIHQYWGWCAVGAPGGVELSHDKSQVTPLQNAYPASLCNHHKCVCTHACTCCAPRMAFSWVVLLDLGVGTAGTSKESMSLQGTFQGVPRDLVILIIS